MNGKGMSISRTRFWVLLRNPVYLGKIFIPAYKQEAAQIVPAIHEALISESLFYEVQDALEGGKRFHPNTPFCKKDELPLRGFLECARCGKPLTGSLSKGRNARYYYYHCNYGCKERFRADEANNKFVGLLQSISGHEKVFRSFEKIMTNANHSNMREQKEEAISIKKEIDTCQSRLDRAQTLMLDGKIDIQEYQSLKFKLTHEINKLMAKVPSIDDEYEESEKVQFGFHFLKNIGKAFALADLDNKRRIIGSIFPEKLIYENKNYRTTNKDNIVFADSQYWCGKWL